jgi:hypothetical protein
MKKSFVRLHPQQRAQPNGRRVLESNFAASFLKLTARESNPEN